MAMTKKDYEKAAAIVREHWENAEAPELGGTGHYIARAVEQSFISLFKNDNPRYDVRRFQDACRRR